MSPSSTPLAPGVLPTPSKTKPHLATLTGHVDPLGRGEVTECYFEYGTTFLRRIKTCAPAPPYSATIRTVEATAVSRTSPPRPPTTTASSPPTPTASHTAPNRLSFPHAVLEVETKPPTEVQRNSATLNGSLDPDSLPTTYHFEYVEAAKYHPRRHRTL